MAEHRQFSANSPATRILQLDVLRGFAVLGIYWVNVFVFALPVAIGPLPAWLNDTSPVNSLIDTVTGVYIEGTMRALFSMLFGASALLLLGADGMAAIRRYYWRCLLLLVLGLVHAYALLWHHDILYAYGVLGLFLFPLRRLSARTLLICALCLLALGDLDLHLPRAGAPAAGSLASLDIMEESDLQLFTADDAGSGREQSGDEEATDAIEVDVAIATYRSSYTTIFQAQREAVTKLQTETFYREYVFDIGGMMLMGMALLKSGVLTGQVPRHIALLLAIAGYVLGGLVRYAGASYSLGEGYPDLSIAYNLGRLLIALGHIGLISLLCASIRLRWISHLLAGTGRMALTNYIMQTVISIFLFYGFGLGLYAQLERHQVAALGIGVGLLQILYSNLWLLRYRHGPLEWLLRSLTHGSLLPVRKVAPPGPMAP